MRAKSRFLQNENQNLKKRAVRLLFLELLLSYHIPRHMVDVPPARLLPGYPTDLPGRVPLAATSGSGYPFSNVLPWSACLTITSRNQTPFKHAVNNPAQYSTNNYYCLFKRTTTNNTAMTTYVHEYLWPGTPEPLGQHACVKAIIRWATGKRFTNRLPYNTLPPFEQRDSWSSYGAVRAYSEIISILWGPRDSDLSDS